MANNRLRFVSIDDNGNIVDSLYFAKHYGGAWDMPACYSDFRDDFHDFVDKVFINGYGIALTDEYNDKPLTVVYNYND